LTSDFSFKKVYEIGITNFSESSVSGGVEAKAEIAGDDEMSKRSQNPSDDLPNQEKKSILNCLLIETMGFT